MNKKGTIARKTSKTQSVSNLPQQALSLLFNNTQEPFILLDKSLRIVSFNKRLNELYKEYLGITVKTGSHIFDYAPPERIKTVRAMYKRVLKGNYEESDIIVPLKNGEKKFFQVKYNPARDERNRIMGVFVTVKDNTAHARHQAQLETNEKRFRALVEHGSDAIIIVSPQGKVSYVSPSIKKVLGYSEQEALRLNLFKVIHPEDVEAVAERLTELLKTPGASIPGYTSRVRHKNGSWRWLEATLTNLLHDPHINGIVDNFRDVTPRMEAQWQRDRALLALNERVKEQTCLFNISRLSNLNFSVPELLTAAVNLIPSGWQYPDVTGAMISFDRKQYKTNKFRKSKWVISAQRYTADKNEVQIQVCYRKKMPGADRGPFLNEEQQLINTLADNLVLNINQVLTREALSQSEIKYRNLFNSSPIPKWIFDIETQRILDVNETAIQHYGYSRDEFLKMTIKDIRPKEELPKLLESQKKIRDRSHTIHFGIFTHQKKNGQHIRVDVHGHKIRFNHRDCMLVACYDVTEREKIHTEITRSNQRYELINQVTKDALYEWDVATDIFHWGESFYRIFGYKKSKTPFRLKDWARLMHPQDDEKHRKPWAEFLADASSTRWVKEFRFKRADGTYAYVEETGHVIRDKHGKPQRMIGVLRDVTENKKTEIQKQVQEEVAKRFNKEASLHEVLADVLQYLTEFGAYQAAEVWLVSDERTHLIQAATYAGRKKGYIFFEQSKEVTRMDVQDGIGGTIIKTGKPQVWSNLGAFKKFIRKASAQKAGLNTAFGVPIIHKEVAIGALIFYDVDPNRGKDQSKTDPFTTLGNFLGIEIKRKRQEEQFQLLFESAPDIMAIASPNGYFHKVNPAFCNLLGYTETELTSRPFHEFVHPDDLTETLAEYTETIAGKRTANNFENRYITKSGGYVWISWSSSDVINDDGHVFSFGRNVTEQRELEELLRKAAGMARIGSWEVDLINNEVYWSPITRQIHEVDSRFMPTLHTGINFYKVGDSRDTITQAVKQAVLDGTPWDVELQIITSKGNERWVRAIGEAEFIKGKCVRLYGSFQDIHASKTAGLEKQQALEERTRILERTNDAFFILDKHWNVVYWNRRAEEIIGIKREELIGFNLWAKFPRAKEMSSFKEYERAFREQVEVHFEEYFEPFGQWYEAHGYPTTENISVFFRDITEKKRAEQALQQAYKEREEILESISDNFYALDKEYRFTYLNKSTEELIGFKKTDAQGINVFDLLPVMKETIFPKKLEEVRLTGKPVKFELYSEPLDAWFDESIYPNPNGYSVFFRNISEKKKAEQALRQALHDKAAILESIGDAFFAVDQDFTVTYWNNLAETMLQTPREKILGKNLWAVFSDAVDLPSYANYHKALRENITVQFEDYYAPIDRWFEISAYPAAKGLSVFFKDVTERKKAVEQIRISNERFEMVARATNDSVWDWDLLTNQITRTGDGFTNLFGFKQEEVDSHVSFWWNRLHPEDVERIRQSQTSALDNPLELYWEDEYRFKRKDGQYAYVYDRGYILRDARGNAMRMIGATQDITPRKDYEASLKKLNADLKKYAKDLKESNLELEQFAFVASHDLQEPLRMVTSFLTKLDKKYHHLLDDKGKQYLHFAVDGASRMRQVILDLLAFSRIGQDQDQVQEINLNELLHEIFLFQKKRMEEKKATIRMGRLPVIMANPAPVRQVLLNLIDNALKYCDATRPPVIQIEASETPTHWQFSVSDNGIGIHPQYYEKIFVLFQRLHQRHEFSGVGMGLALCKKIVTRLGGDIWVESQEGTGSTFYFTISK